MTGDAGVPPPVPADVARGSGGVMKSIIPTDNKPALIGYYCGVFGMIPVLGMPLGVGAIVLGMMGLRKVAREPSARGKAHAWVAIVLGLVSTVGYGACLLWLVNSK